MWRSPVAYLHGVQVVAGSNPVIPTNQKVLESSAIKDFLIYILFKILLFND